MNGKLRGLWAVLVIVCLGSIVGCGQPSKSGKKTSDEPLPNTTDSK